MVGNAPGSANLGPKVFFIWGSFCTLSLIFAYFSVPEMKGLTLEQVDKMMEEVTPRKSAAWVPTTTFAEEMRRINAAKEGSPNALGGGPKGSQQYHQRPFDEQFGLQYSHTPPPQNHNHTPPPQEWQGTCPPHRYEFTPPPQLHQHTPPPQQYQQRPQQSYQRQHTS